MQVNKRSDVEYQISLELARWTKPLARRGAPPTANWPQRGRLTLRRLQSSR
ncbi:MAG: hypothetical protein R3C46_15420 [Hyphomonadaceae bacterium]